MTLFHCSACRRRLSVGCVSTSGRCAACDATFDAGYALAIKEAVSIMLGAAMIAPIEEKPTGDNWPAERVAEMMRGMVKP